MPELAEVDYYRRQWNPGLNSKVLRIHLHGEKRIFRGNDLSLFPKIAGQKLTSSESAGKQMLFRFTNNFWLGLHLGMTSDELMSRELGEVAEPAETVEDVPDPQSPDPSRRPITELDLSVRSRRIVDLLKIRTIGDLAQKTEAELLACPNFGQTSLNEIKTKLDELGLSLRG